MVTIIVIVVFHRSESSAFIKYDSLVLYGLNGASTKIELDYTQFYFYNM